MAVTVGNITKYMNFGRVYVDMDVPADVTAMTLTGGVPAGYHTRDVGATQGATTVTGKPTIALVDIEQAYGGVAPHTTLDAMSIAATLLESTWRNLELAIQQSVIKNYLTDYNSSFEDDTNADGTADYWNQSGTSTRTIQTDPQSAYGAKAQQFVSGGVAGGIISDAIEHPRLIAGAIAVLSGYVKAAAGTPNIRLKIEAFNSSNVSQGSNTATSATTTSYVRYSVAYTLPANTAYVKITFDDPTGQTATFKIDNVQLEIVDSGSTATTYIGPRVLFFGGLVAVRTFPVAVVSPQATAPTKYNAAMIYNAYATSGASVPFQRGVERKVQVTFTGCPVPTRTATDQMGQFYEDQ
jgi:hypothetical protein